MNKTRTLAKPETVKKEPTSGAEEYDERNEKCKRALAAGYFKCPTESVTQRTQILKYPHKSEQRKKE